MHRRRRTVYDTLALSIGMAWTCGTIAQSLRKPERPGRYLNITSNSDVSLVLSTDMAGVMMACSGVYYTDITVSFPSTFFLCIAESVCFLVLPSLSFIPRSIHSFDNHHIHIHTHIIHIPSNNPRLPKPHLRPQILPRRLQPTLPRRPLNLLDQILIVLRIRRRS